MILCLEKEDMVVLAVDVHQEWADLPELSGGDKDAVEVGFPGPLLSDRSLDGDSLFLGRCELRWNPLELGQAKNGFDRGLGFSRPDDVGASLVSEDKPDAVDDDGLSGAGFAGEDGEAGLKMDVQVLDRGQVLNT